MQQFSTDQIETLDLSEQHQIAMKLSTQALLSGLYGKALDYDVVRRDFSEGRYSLLSAFDEKARLRVLITEFGKMMLTATDAQFDKGERSNGWEDLSRREMRDRVIQALKDCLAEAEKLRRGSLHLEEDEMRRTR